MQNWFNEDQFKSLFQKKSVQTIEYFLIKPHKTKEKIVYDCYQKFVETKFAQITFRADIRLFRNLWICSGE